MVEFDVLPEHPDGSGGLVLAHDFKAMAQRTPLTLDEGLDHLRTEPFADIELDVDLKLAGYEERVVAALRERGMEARTLISTMEVESLPVVRAASGAVRLGWSVPRVRRDYLANPATKPAALLDVPRAAAHAAARGRPCDARRRDRRRDVALVARDAALRAHGPPRPAASCTCGRSTTRRASAASSRWASPASPNDPRLFDAG